MCFVQYMENWDGRTDGRAPDRCVSPWCHVVGLDVLPFSDVTGAPKRADIIAGPTFDVFIVQFKSSSPFSVFIVRFRGSLQQLALQGTKGRISSSESSFTRRVTRIVNSYVLARLQSIIYYYIKSMCIKIGHDLFYIAPNATVSLKKR